MARPAPAWRDGNAARAADARQPAAGLGTDTRRGCRDDRCGQGAGDHAGGYPVARGCRREVHPGGATARADHRQDAALRAGIVEAGRCTRPTGRADRQQRAVPAVGAAAGEPGASLAAQGPGADTDTRRARAGHEHRVRRRGRAGRASRGLAGDPHRTLPVAGASATFGRTDRTDRSSTGHAGRAAGQAAGPGPQEQHPGDAGAEGRDRSRWPGGRAGPPTGHHGHAAAVAGTARCRRTRSR